MFEDNTEAKFSLDELMGLREPGTYLVRASGDSMIGVGIFDKDLMVVDKGRDAENGNVIIAAINNEPLVKIYRREPDGQVILASANPKYAPRYILESESFWIWGVVVNSVRMHGKYQGELEVPRTGGDGCLILTICSAQLLALSLRESRF